MSSEKVLIAERIKGPLLEKEEWWYVALGSNNAPVVEHRWSYTGSGASGPQTNEGSKELTIAEYKADNRTKNIVLSVEEAIEQLRG